MGDKGIFKRTPNRADQSLSGHFHFFDFGLLFISSFFGESQSRCWWKPKSIVTGSGGFNSGL